VVLLAADSPLRAVADILEAAAVVGHAAWNDGSRSEHTRMASNAESNLSQDVLDLFSLLRDRGVSYLLVGGVALLKYIEGRNTQDIDFVLSAEALDKLPEMAVSQREHEVVRARFRSVRVDVLLTTDPVFRLVHDRYATTHPFQELSVRCATVEGLLLLKLYALPSLYRQADTQRIALYETDILMLVDRYHPSLDAVLETLQPFIDEGAMAGLRNIVADIEQRIARMRRDGGRT
jgi:hypothetical protein